jgi:hypothetical protein
MADDAGYPAPTPGKIGIYGSFSILTLSIFGSLIVQHYVASDIDTNAWNDYCSSDYEVECKENSSVYRISFALVIFFITQMLGTIISASYFDSYWALKLIFYFLLVLAFFFAPGNVFDTNGYAWFARIAAFAFIILQQVILLDVAYSWNESWVKYSEESGTHIWMAGIIGISSVLFAGSLTVIGLLYWQFSGCPENEAIISLTLILGCAATVFQLFLPGSGSLLTSAVMFSYAVFLCYSAVILNPNADCNPTISTSYQTVTEVIGIIITFISLIYTTASAVHRAPSTISGASDKPRVSLTNVLTGKMEGAAVPTQDTPAFDYSAAGLSNFFNHVNIIFVLISAYYAMVLTNWATEQHGGEVSHNKDAAVGMWIQAAGQWIALLLYMWSIVAPSVFPDREF